MTRLDLSSLIAKPATDPGALDAEFLTVLAAGMLIFGLFAVRRAIQPVREILAAVAAAGAAVLMVLGALIVLILALGMPLL
ncbi:hypothetical protein [Actinoplanes sp. NPDC049118]|uniref:hypothetical protein n=1 Tax=Actinoplanes sp. NPDC049118 TaxID=3155769 RepID=UPI0033F9919D